MVEEIKSGSQRWAAEPMENEFPESVLGTLGGMRVPATTETKDIFCNVQVTMEMRLSTRLIFNSSTDATSPEGFSGHCYTPHTV